MTHDERMMVENLRARRQAQYQRAIMNALTFCNKGFEELFLGPICPHVPLDDARDALAAHSDIAIPASAVKGAYWRVRRIKGGLVTVRVQRSPDSFLHADPHHGQTRPAQSYRPLSFLDEAQSYTDWGLVEDRFADAVYMQLQNPQVCTKQGNGMVLHMAASFLTTHSRDIFELPATHRTPAFEKALHHVDTDPIGAAERCGYAPLPLYYCAFCGHPLEPWGCTGCETPFNFSANGLTNTRHLTMPPKIIKAFTDAGHEFQHDPHEWLPA